MNVDANGLPIQANGDRNDQLQRVAMISVADFFHQDWTHAELSLACMKALRTTHQPKLGLWARYAGAATNVTSGDQIVPALAAQLLLGRYGSIAATALRTLLRLGFSQNYKDGLSASSKTKLPDFLALRALPLFARVHVGLYPLTVVADLSLVLAAAAACGPVWKDGGGFAARSPDDVDDGALLLTLLACSARMATPFSRLANWIYAKWRPWNYGCAGPNGEVLSPEPHPIIGALRWYHRAENGGNPEIADYLTPAVNQVLLGRSA